MPDAQRAWVFISRLITCGLASLPPRISKSRASCINCLLCLDAATYSAEAYITRRPDEYLTIHLEHCRSLCQSLYDSHHPERLATTNIIYLGRQSHHLKMYSYDPVAYTPCPPSKRRARKDVARDLVDETPQTKFSRASSDDSYHPAIVLSTPSRYTRPAHLGSTGPIPSSPPGGPMDQSVLYSPWCPGTPPLSNTKNTVICPKSASGA